MAKPPIPPELQKVLGQYNPSELKAMRDQAANSIPYYGASGVVSQKSKEFQGRASELMGIPDRPSISQFLGLDQSLGMDQPQAVETATPAVEVAAPAVEVAAPSAFPDQPALGQVPSANIGQLPQTPSVFSAEGAAQVNPIMAPQELPQATAAAELPQATANTTFQGTDFQGRLRQFESPEARQANIEAGQASFEQASADRERRAAEQFGKARGPDATDRGRQMATGEGTSTADLTDMAKANSPYASPSDVARGQKVADSLGVNLKTGEPQGGLTLEQELALSREQRAERQEARDVSKQEIEWEQTQGEARQKRTDEMNTEIGALTSIIGQAENIGGVATEASRLVGAGTTGFFSPLKWIGGTTAADLAGNLETIKSDAFVANITEMRANSPTGGAVGNVSDKDLEMLQSLQTSFRQNLKPTTLRNNLKKYKEIRNKVARDAKAGFIRKYGVENFNTHFGNQQQGGEQVSSIPNDRESNTQVDPGLQQYFN